MAKPNTSGKIFVNYRRDDDPGSAGWLHERLKQEFGAEQLFMDVEGYIKPGDDFVQKLNHHVAQCDVLLAVVGPRWLGAADQAGNHRIKSPTDFVRLELVSALKQGKRVIPVLLGEVSMPSKESLPEDLEEFTRRHAFRLRMDRFGADSDGLFSALREIFHEAEERESEQRDSGASEIGLFRGSFWAHFVERHPSESQFGAVGRASSRWQSVGETGLVVVKYLSKRGVGVFVRGPKGADPIETADKVGHVQANLENRLKADFNNERYMFHKWFACDGTDRANWDRMSDWAKREADHYVAVLRAVVD